MIKQIPRSQASRTAFTLAELLVTLALATLLITGLMGIVTRIAAHRRILEEQTPARAWSDRLKSQVEYDFQNCRAVLVKSNQLIFGGYAQLGFDGQTKLHLPTQVVYTPIIVGARAFLVRREYDPGSSVEFPRDESFMCADVDQVLSLTQLDTDVPPGVLNLVWKGSSGGKSFELPMVLVRHGGGE